MSNFDQLVKLAKPAGYKEEENYERPSMDEVLETADRTRLALERISQNKLAAANPKSGTKKHEQAPTFFRYTPGQQGERHNSGAQQRIVRVVDMPVDPMEPPRFKHKKVPNGPPSPPAPVLHSPTRKVTAQEQKDWVIPPCISNWKNSKGYTIPLDKRLAADGRGLQDVQINDKFAILSESLFSAERMVRDEIKTRSLYQQKVAEKEKLQKEESLRALAQKARESRSNFAPTHSSKPAQSEEEDSEDDAELEARQELRREKQKERERELRLSRMGADQRAKYLSKQENRDISEKVALGLAKPTLTKDSMFDSRLFNQTQGISSGFKDEEAYSLYDKALFNGSSANAIYRPKRNMDDDDVGDSDAQLEKIQGSSRFGSALGSSTAFQGADKAKGPSGPVQFQKPVSSSIDMEIAAFLNEAKQGKRGLDTSRSENDSDRPKKHSHH